MFDTHAHIYAEEYGDEYQTIIQDTLNQGVWFNNVGTRKETSEQCVKIANEYKEGVYAVVGAHPHHASDAFDKNLFASLASDPKVVGIGECGLDYFRLEGDIETAKQRQKTVFAQHIEIANQLDKTLVIHTRASKDTEDAYLETLQILGDLKENGTLPRFLIHSFTSNWQICKQFLDLGGYIALNGIITFDKTGVLKEVCENIPLDRLVFETDAPYLSPVPMRGKKNFPSYVKYVAEHFAKLRGIDIQELEKLTDSNAKILFRI